jgi:hypothetical protein
MPAPGRQSVVTVTSRLALEEPDIAVFDREPSILYCHKAATVGSDRRINILRAQIPRMSIKNDIDHIATRSVGIVSKWQVECVERDVSPPVTMQTWQIRHGSRPVDSNMEQLVIIRN